MDVSGNLYIADYGNGRIVKVAAGSTTGGVVSFGTLSPLSGPSTVAVDRIGNIYVADTGNDRIAMVDTAGTGTQLPITMSLSGPLGVAVDVFGAVYIVDTGNNRGLIVDPWLDADPVTGYFYTSSLNKSAVGFGHVQLGASGGVTLTLPFTIGFDQTLGTTPVKAFTFGTEGLDFTVGTNTCVATTSSAPCSVDIHFLPTAPGLRRGAVVLYDDSSPQVPILTLPLYGFGDAPVAALNPNTGSVINTGTLATANPYELALDGAGNMFVGVYSGSNVTKIPAGGGSASVVSLGTPGGMAVDNITGVALDGAGNLFIGDHQRSRILVVTPGGVVSVLNITGLSSPLGFPTALAVDAAGNLYIADFTNGRIIEVSSLIVTGSTSTGKATVVGTGTYSFNGSTLTGMTVDSMGNIYAAARTQNNSKIVKVTAAGVASLLSIPSNITPAINNPQGVGVDAMGNIYIVDTTNNRIVEITTAGVASALGISGLPSPATTLGPTLFGVTVDPSGNLYILDWTYNRIVFVNVSGAALTFATTGVGSTSTDSPKSATVTNLGNQPLIFSANPTYTANFSQNASDTNRCTSSTSLSAGNLCDVSVNFTPQTGGSLSAGITVTNNNLNVSGSTQQVSVSGTGAQPVAALSSSTLSFANQNVGTTSAAQTLTLSNTGNGTLTITAVAVSGDFTQASDCASLTGGSHCTISVRFAPTVRGARTGTLTVTDNSNGVTGSTQTSNLSGTGLASVAGLSASALTFGNQASGTTSTAQTLTISNTGNATLAITAVAITGTNSSDFALVSTCGSSLAAGGTCSINVTFTPTGAGVRSATLSLTDNANAVSGSTQTVSLTGTSSVPVAALSLSSLSFGSQYAGTTSTAQALTLSNTGNAPLTIAGITITGANSGDFARVSTCGSSLAAGGTCSISVTFAPTAAGARAATLSVTDNTNAVSGSMQTASLTGTGLVPVAALSLSSLGFGSQYAGTTSTAQALTLSNTGNAPLTIAGITITGVNSGDFARVSTCGSSLAAGGTCSISVTFAPTAAGARAATLSVTDNTNAVSGSMQTASLTGTGLVPLVSLSTTSLSFGYHMVGTNFGPQTVTLTNTGNAPLTIGGISASSGFSQSNTCGTQVVNGTSCTITVTFVPTVAGEASGALSITDSAAGSPHTVSLAGMGTPAPTFLSLPSLSTLNFGSKAAGTTTTMPVLIANAVNGPLLIRRVLAGPVGLFQATNNCGSSITPAAACTLIVSFTPKSAGQYGGVLIVLDTARPRGFQIYRLRGTATEAPGTASTPTAQTPVEAFHTQGPLVRTGAKPEVAAASSAPAAVNQEERIGPAIIKAPEAISCDDLNAEGAEDKDLDTLLKSAENCKF